MQTSSRIHTSHDGSLVACNTFAFMSAFYLELVPHVGVTRINENLAFGNFLSQLFDQHQAASLNSCWLLNPRYFVLFCSVVKSCFDNRLNKNFAIIKNL